MQWHSAGKAFKLIDLTKRWHLQIWHLDDSDAMIPTVMPSVVPVILHDDSTGPFWKKPRAAAARKVKVPPSGAGMPDMPALADDPFADAPGGEGHDMDIDEGVGPAIDEAVPLDDLENELEGLFEEMMAGVEDEIAAADAPEPVPPHPRRRRQRRCTSRHFPGHHLAALGPLAVGIGNERCW